jgi:hypothetical protein
MESNVLLVEGRDDAAVLSSLWKRYSIPISSECIRPVEGIDRLLETLRVRLKASDLERIGIVVDADDDLHGRWRALHDILSKAGYTSLPEEPDPLGTVIEEEGRPSVGIWIMPDNTLPGMLEHFIGFLIPDGDMLWDRARLNVDDIPSEHCRFSEPHRVKAHVHTWLAWQQDPGTPLGLAITKRYLDADAEHAQRLMNWIRRLFTL